MSQTIYVGIGQAGLQVSRQLWEELRIQYGLNPDGSYMSDVLNEQLTTDAVFTDGLDGGNF